MAEPQQNLITTVALLSSQMGALQHAVEGTLKDHGKRIGVLEEKQIRAEEREKVRAEDRQEQGEQQSGRVALSLTRLQVWFAAIGAIAMVAAVIVSLTQSL